MGVSVGVGEPFRITVTVPERVELRRRLAATRWPEPATEDGQGVPLAWLTRLCAHWADEYSWTGFEQRLNRYPHARTRIEGLDVHYVHVRSPHPGAVPLLLTHGWPGSFVEFLDVIEPLVDPGAHGGDPADAFHVVCPSLPGFGYSDRPTEPGWGTERVADAWDVLMRRLGYTRYLAQGGDWGSLVTCALARRHADTVAGIHLNLALVPLGDPADANLTNVERRASTDFLRHKQQGTGYSAIQSTRPQSLGYALLDSPAGLCAWICDKFWDWTDHDGDPCTAIDQDRILDNVSVYWLTGTAASSARLYWEHARASPNGVPITVPAAVSVFPREIARPSRRQCEPHFRDLRFHEMAERGGHFAALEQPAVFVDHLRRSFATMRA